MVLYKTNGFEFAIKSEDAFTFETDSKNGTVRSTNKMAEGKTCSIVNCGYITPTKVPDETEMQVPRVRLCRFQRMSLCRFQE